MISCLFEILPDFKKRKPKMNDSPQQTKAKTKKHLSIDAQNALEEAAGRKHKTDQAILLSKDEKEGRGGLDPARFGDWEIKGIASDF